jgi:hypothetical protein
MIVFLLIGGAVNGKKKVNTIISIFITITNMAKGLILSNWNEV